MAAQFRSPHRGKLLILIAAAVLLRAGGASGKIFFFDLRSQSWILKEESASCAGERESRDAGRREGGMVLAEDVAVHEVEGAYLDAATALRQGWV